MIKILTIDGGGIRGILPGEYIVNVHFYNEKIAVQKNGEQNYNPMPVQVQIEKINPYNVEKYINYRWVLNPI